MLLQESKPIQENTSQLQDGFTMGGLTCFAVFRILYVLWNKIEKVLLKYPTTHLESLLANGFSRTCNLNQKVARDSCATCNHTELIHFESFVGAN